MDRLINVRALGVGYGGRPVVKEVSFSHGQGIVVLAGPNGAGKSTVLRALAALVPFTGAVELAGHDLATATGRRSARRRFGFLPQEATFPDDFTVTDALLYAAWLQRVPSRERPEALGRALAAVDLGDRAGQRLKELSTGLRRRVFLGQAIVHEPAVLLLDEPTAGVDTEHRAAFRRLVRSLAESRLVVLTTHLTEEIEFLADRLIVLGGGRLRFDGTPAELTALAPRPGTDERPVEAALRALVEPPEGAT